MFSADTYAARRAQLKEALPEGLVLFLGHDESPRNYADNPYPFRQDSSFLYYWGLDTPGLAGLIDVDAGTEVLFGHDPTVDEVVWTGPTPSLAERGRRIGVTDCRAFHELAAGLERAQAQGRTVHLLPQYQPASQQQMATLLDLPSDRVNDYASEALIRAIVAQRAVKSDEEIAEIEASADVAHAMHTAIMEHTAPGVREQTVAGKMTGIAREQGARFSFQPTVSVHGEVLHNTITARPMQAGEMLLCDAGAETRSHYASDITRVTPVSGTFTDAQRALYRVVLEAQERAIAACEVGVPYRDVHRQAARDMASGLKDLGFMRGDVDEAVAEGAHALFFPHGLGHLMGLDVHDMEGLGENHVGYDDEFQRSDQFGLNYLRLARRLEPGFVLTVEPGLYFIPTLIDQWQAEGRHAAFIDYDKVEQFKDFGGIRIEDDVLVTEDGPRILGPPIPKAIDDVEALAGTAHSAQQVP